jgi:hypothetical protein
MTASEIKMYFARLISQVYYEKVIRFFLANTVFAGQLML